MARDSEKTRARILDAVGKLLAENGFLQVGINAVARVAGVDKVLIYRYFGGMPELLRAYARQGDFWPSISELLGGNLRDLAGASVAELGRSILLGHLRALRSRPHTVEIMRWELLKRNAMTDELAHAREQQGLELLGLLPKPDPTARELDVPAVAALLHAGLTYLVLRSATADEYLGLDLHSEAGWKRIETAVGALLDRYFAPDPP